MDTVAADATATAGTKLGDGVCAADCTCSAATRDGAGTSTAETGVSCGDAKQMCVGGGTVAASAATSAAVADSSGTVPEEDKEGDIGWEDGRGMRATRKSICAGAASGDVCVAGLGSGNTGSGTGRLTAAGATAATVREDGVESPVRLSNASAVGALGSGSWRMARNTKLSSSSFSLWRESDRATSRGGELSEEELM